MREKWWLLPTTKSAEQASRTTPKSEVSHCSGVVVGWGSPTSSGTPRGDTQPQAGLLWGQPGVSRGVGGAAVLLHTQPWCGARCSLGV